MATSTRRTHQEQLFHLDSRRLSRPIKLDERTRQIGLAGVAAAKAVLAAQAARRAESEAKSQTRHRRHAA